VEASPSNESYLWLALMLGTYFVNSASLFMLSAIIEKKVIVRYFS